MQYEAKRSLAGRPHVVILGAGASRAACPQGDKNGKTLPLMADLAKVLGMKDVFQGWGIDYRRNFEDIFGELYEKGEAGKIKEVQRRVESYFGGLELPDAPTLYDHLVLSLGKNDIIATFNWDPLLPMAMERNVRSSLDMPRVVYPHGNVRIGYCERDKKYDRAGRPCTTCGEPYKNTPLLYPIRQKDYDREPFVRAQWTTARRGLRQAPVLTVFGYSAPRTDVAAFELIQNAWRSNSLHTIAEIEFVVGKAQKDEEVEKESKGGRKKDKAHVGKAQKDEEVENAWDPIIGLNHYRVHRDFYESSMARYPRRTGEAFYMQSVAGIPARENPIPRDMGFDELWQWFQQICASSN